MLKLGRKLRKLWATKWGPILTLFVWFVVLIGIRLPQLAAATGEGMLFWGQLMSWKVATGAVLSCLVFVLPISFVIWLVLAIAKKLPFQLCISWALSNALRNTRRHNNRAIQVARPARIRDRPSWNRLAAAAIEGVSEDDVIEWHCEAGKKDKPLIFCNFQGYAHAVKQVLDSLENLRCRAPYPHVWTLLKRPIWDWYNPFFSGNATKSHYFTVEWWEDYKSRFQKIKNKDPRIRVSRLVAHADVCGRTHGLSTLYLYGSAPMTLPDARVYTEKIGGVDWHPSLSGLPFTRNHDDFKPERKVYLIGTPRDATLSTPESSKLLDHFTTTYHHPSGNGCGVRYAKNAGDLHGLDVYDDVFIVSLSSTCHFGMAFVDDESRDINGMRFLLDYEFIRDKKDFHEGQFDSILNSFNVAWEAASQDFRVCKGLL